MDLEDFELIIDFWVDTVQIYHKLCKTDINVPHSLDNLKELNMLAYDHVCPKKET
jgi:hypothetical protein